MQIVSGPGPLGTSVSPDELDFSPYGKHIITAVSAVACTQIDITVTSSDTVKEYFLSGSITVNDASTLRMGANADVTDANYNAEYNYSTAGVAGASAQNRADFVTQGAAGTFYIYSHIIRDVGGKYRAITHFYTTAGTRVGISGVSSDADLGAVLSQINIWAPVADSITAYSLDVYGRVAV